MRSSPPLKIAGLCLFGAVFVWFVRVDFKGESKKGAVGEAAKGEGLTEGELHSKGPAVEFRAVVGGVAVGAGTARLEAWNHALAGLPAETIGGRSPLSQLNFSKGPLGWELQLKETISRAGAGTPAAKAILNLLAYLPEEALETATEQAMERLSNEDWRSAAQPILANAQTHGRVLSVLFADLMERPREVSLPVLSQLANHAVHPLASFALDNLKLFLGDDFKLQSASLEPVLEVGQGVSLPPIAPR